MTNLADFIMTNREPILIEWEDFARSCAPASGSMGVVALRDHADQILTAIAADLRTPQDPTAQREKSQGQAAAAGSEDTAAEEHGSDRAESGFTVEQMIAEYRALRASVIRLWTEAKGELLPADVDDLTRFNEAIDQSLAESVTRYTRDLEESKEMFLAILGHDLRTPLGAICTSARFMLDLQELDEPFRTLTERISLSSSRTIQLVADLLDFTRSRLGGGIPVVLARTNLGRVVRDVIDEVTAAHSDCRIEVDTRGEEYGEWDRARLQQVLSNLLVNAVQHGARGSTTTIALHGDEDQVTIVIHNRGTPISPTDLDGLFNPFKERVLHGKSNGAASTGLGLGLYIAERIVSAHAGRIEVQSEAAGTTFTVYLPRRSPNRSFLQ